MVNMRPFTAFEHENLKFLVNHNVKFTQVEITPTGLGKGILDSTAPMRAYFIEEGVHNYEEQLQGQEHKVMRDAVILTETSTPHKSHSIAQQLRKAILGCGFTSLAHIQRGMTFMCCSTLRENYIPSTSHTLTLRLATIRQLSPQSKKF